MISRSKKPSQNTKSKQTLTETLGKLQFRKKAFAEKEFELPSQNFNSLNTQFKNAIKDKIKNLQLDPKMNSRSRQPLKIQDPKLISQEANPETSFIRKENKRSTLFTANKESQNVRLISNLKSKKSYKSSRLEANNGNKMNIFLSQDASDMRKKSSFDRNDPSNPKPVSRTPANPSFSGKRAHRTLEANRMSNFYNLFEDPHQFSINKYTTTSNSGKPQIDDGFNIDKRYQSINYMNLFSKKSSIPENKVKANIESSLKGKFIRENLQEELADEFECAGKKPQE